MAVMLNAVITGPLACGGAGGSAGCQPSGGGRVLRACRTRTHLAGRRLAATDQAQDDCAGQYDPDSAHRDLDRRGTWQQTAQVERLVVDRPGGLSLRLVASVALDSV